MVLFQQIILSDGEWATPNYVIEIRVKGHKYLVSVKRNTCISSFEVVNCSLLHHNYVPLPETPVILRMSCQSQNAPFESLKDTMMTG